MSKFITFEGGEGAGKSTLIEKLYHYFFSRSLTVIKTRAPGGTHAGEEIRTLLLHKQQLLLTPRCELFLFLADRAQHVEEVIRPALERGAIVLCDRFNDSTVAYQGGARGLDPHKVEQLCHLACSGLQPDLTLYLDIDPEIGLKRALNAAQNKPTGDKDRIESEALAFHQSIRKAFLTIAERNPSRFRVLDASKPPEQVFEEALSLLI